MIKIPSKSRAGSNTTPPVSQFPTQRLNSLRELLHLEQEHIGLQESLRALQSKIIRLQADLFTAQPENASRFGLPRANFRTRTPSANPGRMGRGELRAKIFQMLAEAGDEGMSVMEISRALNTKSVNIHSWFHAACRRLPQIQKIGSGLYRLNPRENGATPAPGTATGAGSREIPAAPRSRRGEVSRKIEEILEKAGAQGIKVSEIARQLGTSYRTVHVWLSSTGKKNPNIRRAARGTYRWSATSEERHAVAGTASSSAAA